MTKGRYGIHGGQYMPETLMNAVLELEQVKIPKPYFIAGGLDAGNVAQVVAENFQAYAVDVSGGVEDDSTGLKSAAKMAAFVAEVRRANASV